MRKNSAFSLMETMTLLLILSVVAAATVPLITKRTTNENHGWYACYHKVNDSGQVDTNTMRQIRVENKFGGGKAEVISHEVKECVFDFPTVNPKPKQYTITAIGAGALLTDAQKNASLVEVEGAGAYLYNDPDPEIRRHHILSHAWGYLMNPTMLDDAYPNYQEEFTYVIDPVEKTTETRWVSTFPAGNYGSRFGVVNATCNGQKNTFCTATPGEYVRTIYRLNDNDPSDFQRLRIHIGEPVNSAVLGAKPADYPKSSTTSRTTVETAAGETIVEAQGGYIYQRSNPITKILVPVYDELACKKDGLKLCPQVDGCTMDDYRICMDGGFITDTGYLNNMNLTYPMDGSSFWLTNRLVHTPGIFDGQPEFEAFNNIYHTGLPDSGCDEAGNCQFTKRKLAFGDPTLVYFEKQGNGRDFEVIMPDHNGKDRGIVVKNTYLNGSKYKQQNARPGLVFITW